MRPSAERFIFQQNEPLRIALGDDGKLLICLLDVCRIVGIANQAPSQVMDILNPYQRTQRKMDNGIRALFITYPDLVNIPHRIRGANGYKVKQLCEYIKKEIMPCTLVRDNPVQPHVSESNTRPMQLSDSLPALPKTYTEALRELADTTEKLETMKAELQEMKQTAGYVRELTTLVERTLLLNGIRI